MAESKATFSIISKRVGEGGAKFGGDVRRINQLLIHAGFLKGSAAAASNSWEKASAKALEDFYKACAISNPPAYIDPKDSMDTLLTLAICAGVLIKVPNGLASESALRVFYNHCVSSWYPYGWVDTRKNVVYNDGTKMVWGFEGRPGYAVCTSVNGDGKFFNSNVTTALNCTGFANIVLSLWSKGTIHASPYEANQMVGGYNPLGVRYGMVPLDDGKFIQSGFCFDLDSLKKSMKINKLYYLGMCNGNGEVSHDTVILNGYVYESNIQDPSVSATFIDERWKRMITNNKNAGVRIYSFTPQH
jgi:hypothetical protein